MEKCGPRPPGSPGLPCLLGALSAALAVYCAGCVERVLQIRSDPPGADVFLNGRHAGVTPLDHPFDFYGTFDVALRAKDRASLHQLESVRPPWYEIPPLDFVAENLVPFKIRDRRELRYTLEPAKPLEAEEFEREKAAALDRIRALEGKISPPAPAESAPVESGK